MDSPEYGSPMEKEEQDSQNVARAPWGMLGIPGEFPIPLI